MIVNSIADVNFPSYLNEKSRRGLFDFLDTFFSTELKPVKASSPVVSTQAEPEKAGTNNSSYDSSKLKDFFGDDFAAIESPSQRKLVLDQELLNIVSAPLSSVGSAILELNTDKLKQFAGDDFPKLIEEYVKYAESLATNFTGSDIGLREAMVPSLLQRTDLKDLLSKTQLSRLIQASLTITRKAPNSFVGLSLLQRPDLKEFSGDDFERIISLFVNHAKPYDTSPVGSCLASRGDLAELTIDGLQEELLKSGNKTTSIKDLVQQATQYPNGNAAIELLSREDFTKERFPDLVKAIVKKALENKNTHSETTMSALMEKVDLKEFIGDDKLFGDFLKKVQSLIGKNLDAPFSRSFIKMKHLWQLPGGRSTLNKLIDFATEKPESMLAYDLAENKDLADLAGDRLQKLMESFINRAIEFPDCRIVSQLIVRDDMEVLAGSRFNEFKVAILDKAIENPRISAASAIRGSGKVKEICADRYEDFMKATVGAANYPVILRELLALDEGLDWLNKTVVQKEQEPLNKILDKNFCNLDQHIHYSLGFWLNRLFKAIVPNEVNTPEWRSKFLNNHCPEAIRGKIQVGLQCPSTMAS